MGYNHGYALKKHKEMWKKEEEEYRQLGMTEEQINAIYEMEKAELNSDRVSTFNISYNFIVKI